VKPALSIYSTINININNQEIKTMNNQQENPTVEDQYLQETINRIKNKIVVISGKGGVGKSTVSVNLAYAFAMQGMKVGILDVDIHGPSVAKITGIEGSFLQPGSHGRIIPIKASHNVSVVTIASMMENPDDPIIWRGPMKMNAIKQFLTEIEWPELDMLIVDCPPGTGDEPLSVIQLLENVNGSIIVSTPQDVAFLDARKTINFSRKLEVPVLGIIENMSGFSCPHCGEQIEIFKPGSAEKCSRDFNIPILGQIPFDTDIGISCDSGKPYVYHNNINEGATIFADISAKLLNDKRLNLKYNQSEKER
jgi:ATP-binding protein involved in chromosome partitioning